MVAAPVTNYISLDERGIAYITGTRMKVRLIVGEKIYWGLTPEQIQEGHDSLSLAQVHAALSYYYEHKTQMDAEIERVEQEAEQMRLKNPHPMTREDFEKRKRERTKQ